MQVNVKELTSVLHLRLVFMNILVLQSFLAVSFVKWYHLFKFRSFAKCYHHFKSSSCASISSDTPFPSYSSI